MKFKDKSLDEQLKEAEEFTSEEEAMKKDYFAKTAYDHIVIMGTPPDNRMMDNPNTPLIDLMSDKEVEEKIDAFFIDFEPSRNDNPYARKFFEENIQYSIKHDSAIKSPLAEMLIFFNEVGRLPEKYKYLVEVE